MSRVDAYVVTCRDKAGDASGKIREAKLAEHFAHMENVIDKVLVAGPLLEGGAVVGSLLVLKADSVEAAEDLAKQDPYYAAGVWASVEAVHFVGAAGDWVGGKTW